MKETPSTNKLFISGKLTSIVRRFFFEKTGIKPNYNSKHKLPALFQVLLYAFGNQLSAEEAVIQLKTELPDSLVTSADRLLARLKEADKKLVEKSFRTTVRRLLKNFQKKNCTIAIDYHEIPYYGDKNDCNVRGMKNKNGTNYCHEFATLEVVDGEQRFTLAVKKLSINDDEKNLVIKELIQTAKKHIIIELILLDREFFSVECVKVLKLSGFKYIVPATKNKLIKKKINENKFKYPLVVDCTIGKKENQQTFNLALIEKDDKVFCFATNIVTEDAKQIAELYRKRWSIETGYRSKKKFRIKTTTRNNLVRKIYFYLECLLYNTWYSIKNKFKITICSFKKILEKMTVEFFQNLKNPT